jgi:hypothetical protein
VPEKRVFVERLIQDTGIPYSDRTYFITLCKGAKLPTDDKDSAQAVLDSLLEKLEDRGIPFDTSCKPMDTPADIAIIRHQIEKLLSERDEEEYATRQAVEWEEIVAYMELIITRKERKTISSGEVIELPKAEAPAYFEWVLWRAFLAIDSLVNKPYESRRFKIDQDFLPVGTAPGNGPDLIFEFEDFILVVEVTLTANSRQEAAEGEPVRRHVARIVEARPDKRVLGLFIANKVDTNTVETLRIGFWYKGDDSRTALQIVPITLEQFKDLFSIGLVTNTLTPRVIYELLRDCLAMSNHDAPAWKCEIERAVSGTIKRL